MTLGGNSLGARTIILSFLDLGGWPDLVNDCRSEVSPVNNSDSDSASFRLFCFESWLTTVVLEVSGSIPEAGEAKFGWPNIIALESFAGNFHAF